MPSTTAKSRVIVCHKHPSSGRLTFLKFNTGSICGPTPLPVLSVLSDAKAPDVMDHPAVVLRQVARHLDLPDNVFMLQDFRILLEVPSKHAPEGLLPVYLTALAGRDLPPIPLQHSWLELPDSFELPYLEREILRAAYDHLM